MLFVFKKILNSYYCNIKFHTAVEDKMKKVVGNDAFQRINFLYQISKYVVDKSPSLSSYYSNVMLSVAKKSVLKIHPDIKRQICKKCRCVLINKKTAIMKIKNKKKQKYIEWTCFVCATKKIFPSDKNKDHTIWLEKPDGVVETYK